MVWDLGFSWVLVIGIWNLFGIWSLELGISASGGGVCFEIERFIFNDLYMPIIIKTGDRGQ